MNIKLILKIASRAGKIILENGGETYRTEDAVVTICQSHGVECQCFATLTAIIVTVMSEDHESFTTIIRTGTRTVNLHKVNLVNDLVKRVLDYSLDEFLLELKEVEETSRYASWLIISSYAISPAAFSLLFGGNLCDIWAISLIGLSIYLLSYSISRYELNGVFANTLGGALAPALAYFFVSIGWIENVNSAIIGSLMLLVPGLALTNGLRDLMAGDFVTGISRVAEAALIAVSIAVGAGAVILGFIK